jgi:uncharacterized protein YegP (UPF0339 family)
MSNTPFLDSLKSPCWQFKEEPFGEWRIVFVTAEGVGLMESQLYETREEAENVVTTMEVAIRSLVGYGTYSTLPRQTWEDNLNEVQCDVSTT